ncbi:MAG: peptidoglycan DD-metalloendopeptidase family protein [Candidatus Peribacteraceae bacterium]|jgi:murein DD-endopeptidase MepM/ murein hydrolase activator NlpD|nr:peptidoglycan DD-metalloendopeptidase family protein [Candidatus Peribacteraceae bacterium]|tara:strand:- start:17550 stop:18695 length:1146 start_codon:yes stop_codon:yes gene_type:complete
MHLHIVHRLPIIAAALLLVVSISGVHMAASIVARDQTVEQFDGVLEQAGSQHLNGRTIFQDWRLQRAQRTRVGNRLHSIEVERRRLQREMRNVQVEALLHGSANEDAVTVSQQLNKQRFSQPLSFIKARRLLRRLTFRAGLRSSAPVSISAAERILELQNQDRELSKQYSLAQTDLDRNDERVRASTEQLRAARQMMRETQEIIAALQSHLARIDAQIKRRQEREGIADGTMDAQYNKYEEARPEAFALLWPVVSRISAGFRDASYQRFFGIPHKGIDIAVPQGTPVESAADGVVFLAKDAGLGYSYVLIGHRDGYATLYGHLSSIDVRTGDAVSAGQVIGRSGGAVGGPGSGLVTTGSHLHFELIHNGTHIDPLSLLSNE